eukprot:gb/GECH01009187.1/.p1 GENE.gb/GECH01009187.1/~~gb/GECH01009187.1/.p1  ORF type:complete len:329 (+),score=83.79 gb/GECH01009187.1/:1-987(+)
MFSPPPSNLSLQQQSLPSPCSNKAVQKPQLETSFCYSIDYDENQTHSYSAPPYSSSLSHFHRTLPQLTVQPELPSSFTEINATTTNSRKTNPISSPEFKVIVVGPSNAGKTSLIRRMVLPSFQRMESFSKNQPTTIGVDCNSLSIHHSLHKTTHINLWDIAGHDRFAGMLRVFYTQAAAAIVVFDISDPSSLRRSHQWIQQIREKSGLEDKSPIPIFLWGNKTDRNDFSGRPSCEFLQRYEITSYFETSALNENDHGVWYGLDAVVNEINRNRKNLSSTCKKEILQIHQREDDSIEKGTLHYQRETNKKKNRCSQSQRNRKSSLCCIL